jgi:hypothetical protein
MAKRALPPTLKKVIFRSVIEEIIGRTDPNKETLHFTIHWNAHAAGNKSSPFGDRNGDACGGIRDHPSDGRSARR